MLSGSPSAATATLVAPPSLEILLPVAVAPFSFLATLLCHGFQLGLLPLCTESRNGNEFDRSVSRIRRHVVLHFDGSMDSRRGLRW